MRGATLRGDEPLRGGDGFNPRAHAGRDVEMGYLNGREEPVSIHAPMRGATPVNRHTPRLQPVSIHAPMRGATADAVDICTSAILFQSTRPCGARHWPTRRAAMPLAFQSTRPCGARRSAPVYPCRRPQFQSTRPCGARRSPSQRISSLSPCFNPRAHAGRDAAIIPDKSYALVSIHAPMRGATCCRRA